MKRLLLLSGVAIAAGSAAAAPLPTPWPSEVVSGAAVAQCDLPTPDAEPVNCQVTFEEPLNSGLGAFALAQAKQGWPADRITSPPGKLVVVSIQDEWNPSTGADVRLVTRQPFRKGAVPKGIGGALAKCTAKPDRSLDCQVVDEWPKTGEFAAAALEEAGRQALAVGERITQPLYYVYQSNPGLKTTAPDWASDKENIGYRATTPTEALRLGISGKVVLTCVIEETGAVSQCWKNRETPQGYGFADAALAYSSAFKFNPLRINGKAYKTRIYIPVNYDNDGSSLEGMASLVSPAWLSVPTLQQMQAVWPAGRTEDSALVILRCNVLATGAANACEPISSSPPTGGFGAAAVKLAPLFKAPAAASNRGPEQVTDIPVRLFRPGAEAPTISQVVWLAEPSKSDYDAARATAGLTAQAPEAVLSCNISAAGSLNACIAVAESVPGTAAAYRTIVSRFRANPWSPDGRPVAGARVNIHMKPPEGQTSR